MKKNIKRALVVGLVLATGVALADRVLGTILSTSATITHGDWTILPDAGFKYTVCGYATLANGTKLRTFPSLSVSGEEIPACEVCTPGAWNSAPATCVAQWKTNRGL